MQKIKTIAEYPWKIRSDKNMTGKIDPVLQNNLTTKANMAYSYRYQIDRYLSNDQKFMTDVANGLFMPYHRIMLQAAPGTGKSRFFLTMPVPANTFVVIVEPTKCICSQVHNDPNLNRCAVVINSDTHEHVYKGIQKYVVTAELASPIIADVREKNPGANIWLVVDEAHEVLSDLAGFRNAATLSVMQSIASMGPQDKVFYVSATPEVLSNLGYDAIIKINTARPIQSGIFSVHSVSVSDQHITWARAVAKELMCTMWKYKRPLFVFINDIKQMERICNELEIHGYTVLCSDAGNREVTDYVEKNGFLPGYKKTIMGDTRIDVILTTSVILSGLSIHENPFLGANQFLPCMVSLKPERFNHSQMIQFFTRTRYDVPVTTLIKKTCRGKNGYDPKVLEFEQVQNIIYSILYPTLYGSNFGCNFVQNDILSGTTESCLDETDNTTENLTYFDRTQNRLVADSFAIHRCAWDNYNSRMYIDSNLSELEKKVRTHMHIEKMEITKREYGKDDIDNEFDDYMLKMTLKSQSEHAAEIAEGFIQIKDCLHAMDDCKNNSKIVTEFRQLYRKQLNNIRQISTLCGEESAITYIQELAHGTNKSISKLKHQLHIQGISETMECDGVSLSRAFVAQHFDAEKLTPKDAAVIQAVRQTKEYQLAEEAIASGMPLQQAIEISQDAKTIHENKLIIKIRTTAKAYRDGFLIDKISRLGNEIKIVLDELIPNFMSSNSMRIESEMQDNIVESMENKISWNHKTVYTRKTLSRILHALFNVTELENDSILISASA